MPESHNLFIINYINFDMFMNIMHYASRTHEFLALIAGMKVTLTRNVYCAFSLETKLIGLSIQNP